MPNAPRSTLQAPFLKPNIIRIVERATTRDLEIMQVKRAIAETDAGIIRMETALEAMRKKQIARRCEVARQATRARCANDQGER